MSGRRSAVDHAVDTQVQQDSYQRERAIRKALEKASKAIARGDRDHYAYAATVIRDTLLPLIRRHVGQTLYRYGDRLSDDEKWDWVALARFIDDSDGYVRRFASGRRATSTAGASSVVDRDHEGRRTVEVALQSLTAICECEEIVMEDFASRVDARGFSMKVGEHLQDAAMDFGTDVRIVSERSGALKTLFCGGTGQGKSAALETEAEDYYRRNFEPGRDFKVIDIVGLRDGENWFYDVPQQDEALRRVRKKQGLAPDFKAGDIETPEVEILVPLTPGLTDQNLPYDTADGGFTVTPFTVPAADIRKPLLISMVSAKLTDKEESIVRTAYDDVASRYTDWSLLDLAKEVKARDELSPDKKTTVITILRQLQRHGFIRTREHDRTLDWRELFEDTETISVFSQAFIDDEIGRLIAFGYLAHSIATKRARLTDVPECVVLMRELWKVAPHKRRQAFDDRAAGLQEAIGGMLSREFRENRHSGIHILADTQKPSDLLKPVREMFNRYVVFQTGKETARDIFSWTGNDEWESFYRTMTSDRGQASIVGMVEPAVKSQGIEFVGPIEYAAPSHHHRIEGTDATGWTARAKYLDREELRRPSDVPHVMWDDEVPAKLSIGAPSSESDRPDVEVAPVAAFVEDCVQHSSEASIRRTRFRDAFNAFLREKDLEAWDFDDQGARTKFGKRLGKVVDGEVGRTTVDGDRAYRYLTLTAAGEAYLEEADT